MSKRELDDWLTRYLEYTEQTEPPTTYHTWCGLSVVAGALQRKVYLEWGFETIYPNLFVVLIGPSGKARKGVALGIAKSLLLGLPSVSIAPESTSGREALILAMKRSLSNFSLPNGGKINFHCSITAFSEELSVLLGQGDIKLLANLTDWYDSKDEWEYETIGRGKDSLQGLCFNLMGATAPDWLQSMLPQEAVGGGFTSRVIFIVEEAKGKTVPEPPPPNKELGDRLRRDLERINQLKGEFTFTESGKRCYINWYKEQDRLLGEDTPAVKDTRFAAYCERRATHLRKLMMLVSASQGDTLKLDQVDFDKAIRILQTAEVKMGKTFGGLGQAKNSDVTEKILNYIKSVKTTTRKVIIARFYRDVDMFALNNIEAMLDAMKVVKIEVIPKTNEKVYRWIGND